MKRNIPFTLYLLLSSVTLLLANKALSATSGYQQSIQPVFDRYCVACHACFDAPCQLNLGSYEGLKRGASKGVIYDGSRLEEIPPSRLFIDAQSAKAWHESGFFPVVDEITPSESILLKFLQQKHHNILLPNEEFPKNAEFGINRTNTCPTPSETPKLLEKRPHTGMPFYFPGMPKENVNTITTWLNNGGHGPVLSPGPAASDITAIDLWESWLNQSSKERKLLSRWLFEHWQYAHLYFESNKSGVFYRLVRSQTPPGQAVHEIATRRANDAPGKNFFYRFKAITDTLVYKTHITFPLSDRQLNRIDDLFSGYKVSNLPGYSELEQANPFITFAELPSKARYQFMLDHAEYFVRTFIRGPVCRGRLATDVIRDHFWVLFQAPEKDPYLINSAFRDKVTPLLTLPNIEDDFLGSATQWIDSRSDRNDYIYQRQEAIKTTYPEGVDLDIIWNGDNKNSNAMLTVFRHHDSATVKAGWLGQKPLTTWLLDFPLFEQSYYNLVVNFDVFGNLAHQAQTRLYFDFIRNGAEINFLSLIPADTRKQILKNWYQGSAKIKLWMSYEPLNMDISSKVTFTSEAPYDELLSQILNKMSGVNVTPDPINRPSGQQLSNIEEMLALLSGKTNATLPVVSSMPEASLLLLESAHGDTDIYTLVRNRRHSNVAFILGENFRYQPELDELTIVKGVATGYPNLLFYVPAGSLSEFVADMQQDKMDEPDIFKTKVLAKWAVSRRQHDFWDKFHQTTEYLKRTSPTEAGLLDLNRYEPY